MRSDINIKEASVYVGTYAKYNNGSIEGKWLDLSDFSDMDDFYEACARLHADEEDPEYMFQDYENIPEGLIWESTIAKNFFEVRDVLVELEEREAEAFYIWCSNGNRRLSAEDTEALVASFRDEYVGYYKSEEDFAEEHLEENHELPEIAKNHFDYESYARDLFSDGYWYDSGHVFRNS